MVVCLEARVIRHIETNGSPVRGITSVDDELFVLLGAVNNQVAVYNINHYKLLRLLHLPELNVSCDNDMTSCVRNKCLYISDPSNNGILRYQLSVKVSAIMKLFTSRHISKWSVPGSPRGLSLTPNRNLLVTCPRPTNKLVELSADGGQCVREIELQADIESLRHAVQLTSGQYVVCHGGRNHGLHRVCLVDDKGKVRRSYGGQSGSDVGQLDEPRHLAVDEDSQFVFVADSVNNRVMLLSPTLEFVRDFSEGLVQPQRLYFHHTTCRLYVGRHVDRVFVIQL